MEIFNMKKVLLLGIVALTAFICTGCIKYSYNIEVSDNDKVTISKTQAMNLKFFENYDPQFDEKYQESITKTRNEYSQRGYEVNEYKDNTYTGITLRKENIDFENTIDDIKDDFKNDAYAFLVQRNGLNKRYKIHLVYDFNKALSNISEEHDTDDYTLLSKDQNPGVVSRTGETDSETGDVIETITYDDGTTVTTRKISAQEENFGKALGSAIAGTPGLKPVSELTIKIPKKATKHNATKVISDTEYYWDLSGKAQPVDITIEYEKFDYAVLGIIISVIIVIGLLVLVFNKSKVNDLNGF